MNHDISLQPALISGLLSCEAVLTIEWLLLRAFVNAWEEAWGIFLFWWEPAQVEYWAVQQDWAGFSDVFSNKFSG